MEKATMCRYYVGSMWEYRDHDIPPHTHIKYSHTSVFIFILINKI